MTLLRSFRPLSNLVLAAGALLLLSRCDLPTEAPDFAFTTGVRTPVIFEQSFVLLGPDAEGTDALIDTTSASFDSLFTVNAKDQSIYISQQIDDFDIGDLDNVLPEVDLAPIEVAVDLGSLKEQSFNTTFYSELGVFEQAGQSLPTGPVLMQNGEAVLPVPADQLFPAPSFDLIETDQSTPESILLTDDADGVNAFNFVLTNTLGVTLTDGTGDAANAPRIILERTDGTEIASARFPQALLPNTSASVRMSTAGNRLSGDMQYRFDIGTPDGTAPIEQNPGRVTIASQIEPLRYSETVITNIPAQNDIDASQSEIQLAGDVDFSGIVTSSGRLTITVTNHLPIPIRLDQLQLRSLDEVGSYPANAVILDTQLSSLIQPAASRDIPVDLGQVGIAPRLSVRALASSDGAAGRTVLRASDGLSIAVAGDVQIDRLYFIPEAQDFSTGGTLGLDIDDISFDGTNDFIELKGGVLEIAELANELDLTLEQLQISLPEFRLPPYTPADSLVIAFGGTAATAHKYPKIAAKSSVTGLEIDLEGLRIYPSGLELSYNVAANSEAASKTATLAISDRIRASIGARGLQVKEVAATLQPFSVALNDDANSDGKLDLMADDEAMVAEFGDFSALTDRLDGGLQIAGSELTFSLTTNLTTDIDFYAAIVGTTPSGEQVFLKGAGDYAVSASDTVAQSFTMGGTAIPAESLIRFRLQGATSPDAPFTNTLVLSADNSTVDAFISELPETLRLVGKAVVGADGRVQLREPFQLDAALGANIPLNIGGAFSVNEVIDADLSELENLTAEGERVTLDEATLMLTYDNGIPLGIGAQVEVLDAAGAVLLTLPADGAVRMEAAAVNESGAATAATPGMMEFPATRNDLELMSRGEQIRLKLDVETANEGIARLRATDGLSIGLQGNIRLKVQAGN